MSVLFREYELIANSGLFDPEYYIRVNPDVAALNVDPVVHYLETGALELRNPSDVFDARGYAEKCRQRGESVDNPLLHFIQSKLSSAIFPRTHGHLVQISPEEVLIGIDQVHLEQSSNGARLNGAGWCVALEPIVALSIAHKETEVAARYGLLRTDVARIHRNYPKADHSGFEFQLEIASDIDSASVEVVLSAKTATGKTVRKAVAFAVTEPATPKASDPPMQLFIDSMEIESSGILRLTGWAVCLVPIAGVQIFVDNIQFAAADVGKPRDDVAMSHSIYPNARQSGFELRADISEFGGGEHVIKVRALASTGISRETTLPVTIPGKRSGRQASSTRSRVELFCDAIHVPLSGTFVIQGWAVGSGVTERLSVLLDGKELGEARIGIERPDVGNHYPELPYARYAGFSFQCAVESVTQGEHLVVLRLHAAGGETEVLLPVLASSELTPEVANQSSAAASSETLKLSIDLPHLADGAVSAPIRSNLEIGGWALARNGVASIEIFIDDARIKEAATGIRRRDVQQQFPDWEDALTSGFSALVPHRTISKGVHTVRVALRDKVGGATNSEFRIQVDDAPDTQGPWSLRGRMTAAEYELRARPLKGLEKPPVFALVLQLGQRRNSPEALRETLTSLRNQVYDSWKVYLIASARKLAAHRRILTPVIDDESMRVTLVTAEETEPDSLEFASGATHIMFLQPGDKLSCDALLEFAVHTHLNSDSDFIYCDERRWISASGKAEAFFKPQWSPDLLFSTNYLGRSWCARSATFSRAGIGGRALASTGEYDLVLRLTEAASGIRHIPVTLLEATKTDAGSVVERRALVDAVRRRGLKAKIRLGRIEGTYRVCRDLAAQPMVSIIIPTCAARGLIRTCVETLRNLTVYPNFEIVCIENIPEHLPAWKSWLRANVDHVIETSEPFNWSRFNNIAMSKSSGELLLFLNDDIEIVDAKWLNVLVEQVLRPEVGVVGPQLLYPDRRVQHAGMFLAGMGVARHAFRYAAEDDPCYFGLALTQREVMAVTGACFLTRRETFEALGRFNETHDVVNNDLDYCLRVWQRGLRTIYTPHTQLIHHELASRSSIDDSYDSPAFESQWRNVFVSGDPYYHPRLAIDRDDFSPEWEPTEVQCAGYPVFLREGVLRILVIKLDHIGDCVIALPAVRRLKRYFPNAKISVLTGRATKAVWALEPAVDEILEFDFFHARSASGLLERSEDDWDQLRTKLAPYQFDLAIDMRKHWETRSVLKLTGARYLAGFDMKGRFPWLDVAIEWSEDIALIGKRQHTTDDLVNLVDAIGAASEPNRSVICQSPKPLRKETLANLADGIFEKPVVCVHPTAGNETKQWPPTYFGLLIDQLIALEGVHVILIGGPDDMELGMKILHMVTNRSSTWSVMGQIGLGELPALIARCALFIGNDSGPKHIAAGLGVATVGIHSGVVDANEWGPKGTTAVAVRRAMSCSPCYYSKVEECNRGLACLRGLLPADVVKVCQRMLATSRLSGSGANEG